MKDVIKNQKLKFNKNNNKMKIWIQIQIAKDRSKD